MKGRIESKCKCMQGLKTNVLLFDDHDHDHMMRVHVRVITPFFAVLDFSSRRHLIQKLKISIAVVFFEHSLSSNANELNPFTPFLLPVAVARTNFALLIDVRKTMT